MKALFLLTAITFAGCALTWFFTWAVWIHAPVSWNGTPHNPLLAVKRGYADGLTIRLVAWYRRIKVITIVLLVLSALLLWAWHESLT